MPFEDAADANRVLEAVRWHLAQEKTLDEALAHFQGEATGPNQVRAKLDVWIETRRRATRAGDLSPTYLRELERFAKAGGHFGFWDGLAIFQVSVSTLEDWSSWLADRGLSPKSRWNVLAAFHAFLVWLYRREDLKALPREYPWPRVPEHAPAVLSARAQAQVIAAVPEPARGIFLALGLMGLRPGEAVALSAGDYRDGWLTVARARKGARLDAPVRGTKTGRAKRLPVPAELAEWLAVRGTMFSAGVASTVRLASRVDRSAGPMVLVERRPQDDPGGDAGSTPAEPATPATLLPGAPLFPNPRTGERWGPSSLRRAWRAACKAAGVTISLYEGTKHTFATDAALRGVPERHLQAYLGHADPASTRRYARLANQALVEVLPRRRKT